MIDKNKDYNGILPYDSIYKSVYQGVCLEFHLSEHCNLNCAGCNHFAPAAEKKFLTPKDFEEELKIIVKTIPTVKAIILLGGEPILNKDLLQICKIARKYLPEADISVMTNGILLKNLEKDKEEYKQLQITFDVCVYPGYTDIKALEKGIQDGYMQGLNTRFTMQQSLVDDAGYQNPIETFFYCHFYQLPCFQIKDFKLYICPFSANVDNYCKKFSINIPEDETDYLNLKDITLDKLHKFCFSPKNKCKYCDQRHQSDWPWHLSDKTKKEYNIPNTIQYYFSDYEYYKKIINNKKYFCDGIDKNITPAKSEMKYGYDIINDEFYKFGHGKLDIIIPYYNLSTTTAKQLFNTLSKQSIIKQCMTYLISDGSTNDNEIIDIFSKATFPITYLKNENNLGPGIARNEGINNSFNKYLIFFDADDEFNQDNSLEIIYNQVKNKDVYYYKMQVPNSDKNKDGVCLSRKMINKYDLRFLPLYHGEDYIFDTLIGCCPENKNLNESFTLGYYNVCNKDNIASKIDDINYITITLAMFFSLYYINKFYKKYLYDINDKQQINSKIYEIKEHFISLSTSVGKETEEYNFILCILYLCNNLKIIKDSDIWPIDFKNLTMDKNIYNFLKSYSMKYNYHKYANSSFTLLFSLLEKEDLI